MTSVNLRLFFSSFQVHCAILYADVKFKGIYGCSIYSKYRIRVLNILKKMNKYWTYHIWTNYGIENKESFGSSSDMNIFEFLFFYEFSSWIILDIISHILKAKCFSIALGFWWISKKKFTNHLFWSTKSFLWSH